MKTFIMLLLPFSFLGACDQQQQTKDFIPGTYVSQARSDYSMASDTLQILPDAATAATYHVVHRTGYARVLDGKLQPPQYKVKAYTGIYDAQKQTVQLTQNGVLLRFLPDSNELYIENSKYRKL